MPGGASSRRPNGRSSIYLGQDGRWHGRVTMGVRNDGTPDRRHVTGTTESAVTKKVQALEQQRTVGSVADTGRAPTVEHWLQHWLRTIAARKVRASTYEGYRTKIEYRIIPGLGAHRLDRLQPEHLERFYSDLLAEGLAPATVLQIHRILSRALKVALQRGASVGTWPRSSTRRAWTTTRCSPSQPRKHSASFARPPVTETPHAGLWRWPWGCGRGRRWA